MRQIRSFWVGFVGAAALGLVVLVAGLRPESEPRIAHACSGGPGPFAEYAVTSEVVVLAQAVSVGGPENAAPTVTPMPTLTAIPPDVEWNVSLEGIGATLQVSQAIGNVPVQIDVDGGIRENVEQRLRHLEANPYLISSCAPDFGVHRYVEGQTYLLFLDRDEDGGWYTVVQWETDGEELLTGGAEYEGGRPALVVPKDVLDAYFLGVPAIYNGAPVDDTYWAGWIIDKERLPLDSVLAAILVLRSGSVPAPASTAASATQSWDGGIAPPSVGDAGLAGADGR